jgi:hypothetical protein
MKKFFLNIIFFPKTQPKWWFLLKSVLMALTAFLIAASRYTGADPKEDLLLIQLIQYLNSGWTPLVLLGATPLIVFIFDGIVLLIDSFSKKISYESYKAIVTAFNDIVGYKLKRFSNPKINPNEPFCMAITQPELQIEEITQQIYNTVRFLLNTDEIKIVLAEVSAGKILQSFVCAPKSHMPSLSEADFDGTSFIESVVESSRFEYIEDLEKNFETKEKKYKYVDGEADKGSIVGFPIKKPAKTQIDYVLTIKSTDNIFDKSSEKKIGKILNMFFIRIQLERRLMDIKVKYSNCSNSPRTV